RPSVSALRAAVEREVPAASVPTDFVVVDALPLGENGKVDTGALPPPTGARPALDTPYRAPGSDLEEALAAIWADVLALDEVGVDDGFRELGGDSLLAAEMLARAEAHLRSHLPDSALVHAATVAELAALIQVGGRQNVTAIQEGSGPTLVFSTGELAGGGLFCRELARLLPGTPMIAVTWDPDDPGRTMDDVASRRVAELAGNLSDVCVVAGYCGAGGLLALELAHRLPAIGVEVPHVLLLDTFPPGGGTVSVPPRPARLLVAAVTRRIGAVPGLRAAIARRVGPFLYGRDGRLSRLIRGHRVAQTSDRYPAAAGFVPSPVSATLRILWPVDEPLHPTVEEFRAGWSGYAPAVEVTPVPGDHRTAVTAELAGLAAAVGAALAAADATPGSRRPS
ncbi:MAG: hypothetical protein FJW96_03600, partial [Actinobacteria bacterium]|nr:hypothetical protein [Actinomycetota bacterium]